MERLRGLRAELPSNDDLEADVVSSTATGPDGFAEPLKRLPKGHGVATKHAEAVLLDRMYLALEAHYDRVLMEECQQREDDDGSAQTDSGTKRRQRALRRGMQYITEKRYEALEVPAEVASVLRKPQSERQWPVLLTLANVLRKLVMEAPSADVQSDIRRNLSDFGQEVDRRTECLKSVEELKHIAHSYIEGSITPAAVCDLLLLDVAMVQWLRMIRKWQSQDVAWTTKDKVSAVIRWYLLGQNVGQTPMYEGICAFCGTLLYGALNTQEFGNKWSGHPVNANGSCKAGNGQNLTKTSQPPFLLRWSPAFLAEKVPDVFSWDARSKKLQLREHHRERPPWIRPPHHRAPEASSYSSRMM